MLARNGNTHKVQKDELAVASEEKAAAEKDAIVVEEEEDYVAYNGDLSSHCICVSCVGGWGGKPDREN